MIVQFEVYTDGKYWCARGIGADIFTQAKTRDDLTVQMNDAAALHFAEQIDAGEEITVVPLTDIQDGDQCR